MQRKNSQLVLWSGFVTFTHKARVRLPDWEKFWIGAVPVDKLNYDLWLSTSRPGFDSRTENYLGGAASVEEIKKDLPTSPSGSGFDSVTAKKKCTRADSVTNLKWIPPHKSKRPTRASNLGITMCTVSVARICGSQP